MLLAKENVLPLSVIPTLRVRVLFFNARASIKCDFRRTDIEEADRRLGVAAKAWECYITMELVGKLYWQAN